ncbi:hypothetical protein [Streptomyces katrae]|uniref:hypothetical protein n=1 Tax=Streptomyces katrae TaxID=68223 RepID=UPI0004C1A9F6|nr:hypothetical protein [Streptomyces katrae]
MGQVGALLLADVLTVLPAAMWLNGTGRATTAAEATAVRPVHRWDTTLAAALATIALAIAGASTSWVSLTSP